MEGWVGVGWLVTYTHVNPWSREQHDNATSPIRVVYDNRTIGVSAEALRATIDIKSAISLKYDQFDPKFQVEGVAPPIIFLHGWLGQ